MAESLPSAVHGQEQLVLQICADIEGGVMDYLRHLDRGVASRGAHAQVLLIPTRRPKTYSLSHEISKAFEQSPGNVRTVVLHFSGYGLARWGLCFWIISELRQLRRESRHGYRLLIIFHELFAFGPPWASAFWSSPAQRWIAAQLLGEADAAWTTTERHGIWLRHKAKAPHCVTVQPVFSTIGELAEIRPWEARRRRLIVFGSEPTRKRAFLNAPRVGTVLRTLALEEVVEIGSGNSCGAALGGIPCRFVGKRADSEILQLLSDSMFGLLDYPSDYLAKSSVFAAYAAQGCVVVNSSRVLIRADGLSPGVHYLGFPIHSSIKDMRLASVAAAGAAWYRQHAYSRQLDELMRLGEMGVSKEVAVGSHRVVPQDMSSLGQR